MNSKSVISGLMALCIVASGTAFAQRNDRGNDHSDRNDRNDRGNQVQRGNDGHDNGNHGRNDRNDYTPVAQNAHGGARGAGPRHDMRRGGRLANDYRGNQYVVSDWRGHHLSAPPRGSHWVQAGSDYVLVAVATGIIAQVLLNN
jgi:Ni/Co efflux regulator RcnB